MADLCKYVGQILAAENEDKNRGESKVTPDSTFARFASTVHSFYPITSPAPNGVWTIRARLTHPLLDDNDGRLKGAITAQHCGMREHVAPIPDVLGLEGLGNDFLHLRPILLVKGRKLVMQVPIPVDGCSNATCHAFFMFLHGYEGGQGGGGRGGEVRVVL